MPQITVIVPVYKVEPYLRRCVDSILAQTFTDFELVLVDDGSPDNCGAICDEYAGKDTRIHVIHQPNGGLSAARNAGIDWAFANSDSEWLAFVDSDDWVHPKYLELLYKAVRVNGTLISACDFLRVNNEKPTTVQLNCDTELIDWETFLLEYNVQAVVAWNKLYAKELFAELRYPVGKIHEDEFLTYKLLYHAKRITFFHSKLYYYYQNPDGIMGRAFTLKRLDIVDAAEERLGFTETHGGRRLFERDLLNYMATCQALAGLISSTDTIPSNVKKRKIAELREKVRGTLLRYGLRYVPPIQNRNYYSFAFPTIAKPARLAKRIVKSIIRRT